jgi:hypothetical protein
LATNFFSGFEQLEESGGNRERVIEPGCMGITGKLGTGSICLSPLIPYGVGIICTRRGVNNTVRDGNALREHFWLGGGQPDLAKRSPLLEIVFRKWTTFHRDDREDEVK